MQPVNGHGPLVDAQPVQPIPVQPVPTHITVGQATASDGTLHVALSFATPQGVNVFFIEPDNARRIGVELQTIGSAGQIVIPQNPAIS